MAGKGTAGYNSDISVDDGGGHVAVACDSITPSMNFDEAETTEFGDAAESQLLTTQRVELGLSGTYRPGGSAGQDPGQEDVEDAWFNRTELEVRYDPIGNTAGNTRYTFNGHVVSWNVTTSATDKVSFEATIRLCDGTAIAKSTIP